VKGSRNHFFSKKNINKKLLPNRNQDGKKNVMKILQILLFFWGEKSDYFASPKNEREYAMEYSVFMLVFM